MHPWSLKIPIDDNFLSCVSNLTRFTFVTMHIQNKLIDSQFELFKKLIFGHFLAMGDPRFSGNLVHYLLLRLVVKQVDNEYQMWFRIDNEMLRFSLQEWCLVTRLKCGNVESLYKKHVGWRIRDQYFGAQYFKLNELEYKFDDFYFANMDDTDALRIALFYFRLNVICFCMHIICICIDNIVINRIIMGAEWGVVFKG